MDRAPSALPRVDEDQELLDNSLGSDLGGAQAQGTEEDAEEFPEPPPEKQPVRWFNHEVGVEVSTREVWKSPWVYMMGTGWRADIQLLVLMHTPTQTFIELSPQEPTGFVYKIGSKGDTPASTPGNTPRLPNKVKRCNAEGYLNDWRFNGADIVRSMQLEGGRPLIAQMRVGAWSLSEREPISSAREVFDSFDTDGGGSMDGAELKQAAKVMGFVLDESKPIPDDGIDFTTFLGILGIPEDPERCMLVSPIGEGATDMEIWLMREGFVFLSATTRDEALLWTYPDFTVPKEDGHQALPRADRALKQAQYWKAQEFKAAEAARLEEQARVDAENAIRAAEIKLEEKAERRRRREAGLDDLFANVK